MNILEFLSKYYGCPCNNLEIKEKMEGECHPEECKEQDCVMCWMRVLDKNNIKYF